MMPYDTTRWKALPSKNPWRASVRKCSTCLGALSGANSKRKVPRSVVTTASRSSADCPNAAATGQRRRANRWERIASMVTSGGAEDAAGASVGDNGEARRRNELECHRSGFSGAGGRVGRVRGAWIERPAGRLFFGDLGEGRVLPFHSFAGNAGGLAEIGRAHV